MFDGVISLQVVPSDIGQNLPFYFPLLPSYWRCSSPTNSPPKPPGDTPESHRLRTAASEEYSTAVSIQNLTKTFRTTEGGEKHAVDGLSLDMYQGQITALLGHSSS